MKTTTKHKKEAGRNTDTTSKEMLANPGKAKILHTETGIAKQYPKKPGYHGTDDGENLSPEE